MKEIVYRRHTIRLESGDPRGLRYHSSLSLYEVRNGGKKWFRASSGWGESYGRNSASALLGAQQLIDRALGPKLRTQL